MTGGTLGKVHLWLTFVRFHLTFPVQHWVGAKGMPRRLRRRPAHRGFTTLNTISSIRALRLGLHADVHLERLPQLRGGWSR